jgi:hypothetical protein
VQAHQVKQMAFAKNNHMVKQFSAQRSDEPLDVPILPGRSQSGAHLRDAEIVDTPVERLAIDAVSIANQADRSSAGAAMNRALVRYVIVGDGSSLGGSL